MLYRLASRRATADGDDALAADYNSDGNVDMRDSMSFYRIVAGRV